MAKAKATKATKAGPSAEALAKGAARKRRSSQFTAYIKARTTSRDAKADDKRRTALDKLNKELEAGTVVRRVPAYSEAPEKVKDAKTGKMVMRKVRLYDTVDGVQVGRMVDSVKNLLPHERLARMAKRAELQAALDGGDAGIPAKAAELRPAFIEMLPTYAAEIGCDAAMLQVVGVPDEDLIAAGLLEAPAADDAPAAE